jgi:hypothetical protein
MSTTAKATRSPAPGIARAAWAAAGLCLMASLVSCDDALQAVPSQVHVRTGSLSDFSGSFPRFPQDTEAKTLRDVMVFYSPDDIFSNITWKFIGYPDSGFFMIHNAFPKLKCTIQTVAENRYLGDIPNRNIENDPVAAQIWRDLFTKPEFRSWLEFGNHGYFHSPDGDPNLDHHEFNGNVNPAAFDSGFCYGTFAKARKTYAALGLDNDRIFVMRFPGYAHTPMALRALPDMGFLAYFEYSRTGREKYLDVGGGREILAIPTVQLVDIFDTQKLVQEIQDGFVGPFDLGASRTYQSALAGGLAALDSLARDGGVINLFDHWWEHSRTEIKGVHYRYRFFKDILEGLDRKYGKRVWWAFGSDLALWSHLKRNAPVSLESDRHGATVSFGKPLVWKPGWSVSAGYTLATNDSSAFPAPWSIRYSLESEGYAKAHFLGANEYWVEGDRLHFAFPYSGALKVRVSFDADDRDGRMAE